MTEIYLYNIFSTQNFFHCFLELDLKNSVSLALKIKKDVGKLIMGRSRGRKKKLRKKKKKLTCM